MEVKNGRQFVIEKAKNGQFYFNLKASNGQVILTSEMYKAKSGATNGIESIQKNAADDGNYEKKVLKQQEDFREFLMAALKIGVFSSH